MIDASVKRLYISSVGDHCLRYERDPVTFDKLGRIHGHDRSIGKKR